MSTELAQATFVSGLLRAAIEAGEGVLTLAEGLQPEDLQRSRLTRQALLTLLRDLGTAMTAVPPPARQAMPEIDWDGWLALPRALQHNDTEQAHEALVMGVYSLVPATLLWFRVYQPQCPTWFSAPGG